MHMKLGAFYSKREAINAVGSVCWKESIYVLVLTHTGCVVALNLKPCQ